MKRKLLASLVVLAALAVPTAVAAQGKAKPSPHCTRVAVILKGTLTATPGAGATQISMNIKSTSHRGHNLVGLAATISTNSHTKIVRLGKKSDLSSLRMNDRVNVQLKVCTKDLPLTQATLATTPAKRITATVAGPGFKG